MKIEPLYNKKDNYIQINENTWKRFKVCQVTKQVYSVTVNATDINNWMSGMLIQNAMPNLTLEQREFLISGLTPEEFKELYKDE